MTSARHLHLNLLVAGAGHQPGAWRSGSRPYRPTSLADAAAIAQTAERGKLDAVTWLDERSLGEEAGADPDAVRLESLVLLAALAPLTQRIGLMAEVSTQHVQPYNIARRLASLDHTSHGRAGWLVQEYSRGADALNFDADDDPRGGARSAEFVSVLRRLWDSWEDEARVADKARGHYVDITRIQAIDHAGPAFKVSGPIDIPRSPQGNPVVVRAGPIDDPRRFADADAVINRPADLAAARDDYRRLRIAGPARVLPVVTLVCSPSDGQRRRQAEALSARAGSNRTAHWPVIVGRPDEVAKTLLDWVDSGAADGFSLAPAIIRDGLDDVVDYLVPELQRLGRYRREYAGATLRDHLGLSRPVGRRACASAEAAA